MLLRSIVVGCLLALAGPATAGLPPRPISQDLFSVAKHGQFTLLALADPATPVVAPSHAAQMLFMAVQDRTDHPLGFSKPKRGDKNYGTYYLHYVWPDQGYTAAAHAAVLAELGWPHPAPASQDDFVEVSKRRFETELVRLLQHRLHPDGTLDLSETELGMVIYAIAIRVHTVQDIKHRMQLYHEDVDISSWEHFLRFPVQLFSDLWPARWRQERAAQDTAQFFRDLSTLVGDRVSPGAVAVLHTAIHAYAPKWPVAARDLVPEISPNGAPIPTPLRPTTPSFSQEWMFPAWDWYGREHHTVCTPYDPHPRHVECKASLL